MAINLGDLDKQNKKREEEEFNNTFMDLDGLHISKDSYNNTYERLKRQRQEELDRLSKQYQDEIDRENASFFDRFLNTLGDFATDFGEGFLGTLEGMADWGTYRLADFSDLIGQEQWAKDLRGNADFNSTGALFGKNENVQENLFDKGWTESIEKYSYSPEIVDQVFQGVGNIGALAATTAVTGGGNLATIGASYTSAYGNARSEAKRNGASDRDANRAGIINGFAEALSEQFFEGMPGLKVEGWGGKFTGKMADKVQKYFGTTAGKIALKTLDAAGEGTEEIISNALVAVGNDLMHYYDSNYTYGMENQSGDLLQDFLDQWTNSDSWNQFLSASLTSAFLGSAKAVIDTGTQNKIINAYAKDNSMSFKDAKYILTGQLESAKQELQRDKAEYDSNVELEDMAKKRVLNYMQNTTGANIESQIDQKIREEEQNLGTKFTDEQREKMRTEIRSMYEDRINSQNRYQEFTLEKEPTDEREKGLYESFKQNNRNNTKETHEIYKFIKTLQDNNPTSKYRLTSNEELAKMGELQKVEQDGKVKYLKDGKEVSINGFKKGDTIYINADAVNPYQATIGHEIGEAIKASDKQAYDSLKKLVKQVYGEGNLDDYKQIYGENLTDNVEDEYVNDKLGEMFKDNKLIDRISGDRNLLQRFIDEVKRLLQYVTSKGEKKQLLKLQKSLQDKYIELYKEADFNRSNENASFSLQEGLEKQGEKILEQANADYEAARQNILDYLEENNIENPTKQDMMDAFGWYDEYDASQDMSELQRAERIYSEAANDLLKERQQPKYSLSQDSQGRELTKEQQEYFKDSKVRDDNGNLLQVYHTTTEYTKQFNEFNPVGTPRYKYGDIAVNFFTDSQDMSSSYGYNMLSPDTRRIESMKDLNDQLGDRYRIEEKDGKYELYDTNDEKQIDSYKELIKIFNQEEQNILNKTFNKSRSEVRELLNNDEEQFEFYDKTRTKFLNMLTDYNKFKGLDLNGTNMTIDALVENYLNNESIKPIKVFDSQKELFRNAINYVSPYEHYQYNGYLDIANPYIVDAKGMNWNRIQVENIDKLKQNIKEKWDIPERQLDRLKGETLKELNKDLTKLGYQIQRDSYGDLNLLTKDSTLAIDLLNVNDVMQEIRTDLDSDLKTPISTNDIVFQALAENEAGANYDGVIIENVIDYGENSRNPDIPNNVYVTFNSNQFKAADNLTPTQDQDIRYSLSADGLKNLANELGESYSMLESNLTGRDRAGIKRYLENYTGIVDKYLADNNIQVEPAYRDIEFTRVRTPELQQFVRDNDLTIEKLANDKELQDKYFDLWFGDANEEKFTKQWRDLLDFVKENPREGEIPRPLRAIQREMQQIRDGETQEIDESATKSKKLDAAIDNGYDFWIEEQITPLFEKIDYDVDEVMDEAKANHGTTDDYNTGAYMTTDGELLDFNDGGYRDDHRTISVFNLDMQEFMDYGAIRMKPEANGFEMAVEPTAEQYSRLEDYINNYIKTNEGVHSDNSTIWVDFDIPGTNNYNSASYNINTPTSKIINDIKEYYKTGRLPQKSEYADFYYSLSKDTKLPTGFEGTQTIKDYTDYIDSLNTYNLPTNVDIEDEESYGVLTKEDYKNKKKELYENYVDRAASKIDEQVKAVARRNLELKSKDIADLKAITDKYSGMSREDIYNSDAKQDLKNFVEEHSHQEYEEQMINDEIQSLQKDIRSREFIISNEYKGEFPDGITQFKKNNPGIKIKFGQKGNLDTQLQELAELYPGQVNADVSYGDIPYVLADIMKQNAKTTKMQEFNLTEKEIDDITNKMFYGLTNNAISEKDLDRFVTTIQDKIRNKYARQMAIKEYRQQAKDLLNKIGLENIKDKKRGLLYQINTMKRNLRDIMSQENAQEMYDTYFKPISLHNAQIETDISDYNSRIQKYNLNNAESTYTQMLGELKYNPETSLTEAQVNEYLAKNKNKIDTKKVNSAIEEFRGIYDELLGRINEALEANGYKPIDYRKGYFPHFIEDKASSMLGKFAEKLGWEVKKGQLPTDIAGITEEFQPGKVWTSFSQQRTGDTTDYNALKGMDNYLRGAMDVIYHTQDIQRLRALEAEIRYQYSEKGVQEKLDEIFNNQDLSNEEKYAQAALIVDNQKNNPLGNFATELRNYTNNLANKKSISDRGMEQTMGRDMYSIMNNISGRVSANMVGANISSAMTNFIPITQAWSQVKTKNMLRGIYDTIKASIRDDGFTENSVYLTNRTQQADRLFKTKTQKATDVLGKPFEAIDSFTSNVIVRAKYYQNLEQGMNQVEAMDNADEFAKDVMAGRSKGDSPTMFNKKNPISKLFTAFQLEVNNQYGYMFKDIKADLGKEAKDKIAMAFMKMFIGAWLYNAITEKITGRKAAFSPIDMAIDDAKIITNENMDLATKIQNLTKSAAQEAPFLGGVLGGGRLPIQGAIPYNDPLSMVLETGQNIGALMDDEKRDAAINSLKKEWLKPVYYLALPVAGGQIKKTNEGLAMYNHELPGSYTDSGKLRFEADTSPLGRLQAAVFGQYASGNAREYFDEGYTPLSEKQVQEAMDANLPIAEYREINKGITNAKKEAKKNGDNQTEAEYDYIYNLPISMEQKNSLLNSKLGTSDNVTDDNGYVKYTDGSKTYWYDEENDIVYNSKYREMDNVDIESLTKYNNKKDLTDYGNYGSLDEFNYATKNPTKYAITQQISSYDNYVKYKDDIAAIKDNYNDNTKEGQKKAQQEVFNYINSLPMNQYQKLMLQKMAGGYSIKNYEQAIFNYINNLDLTKEEKQNIHKELFG